MPAGRGGVAVSDRGAELARYLRRAVCGGTGSRCAQPVSAHRATGEERRLWQAVKGAAALGAVGLTVPQGAAQTPGRRS